MPAEWVQTTPSMLRCFGGIVHVDAFGTTAGPVSSNVRCLHGDLPLHLTKNRAGPPAIGRRLIKERQAKAPMGEISWGFAGWQGAAQLCVARPATSRA